MGGGGAGLIERKALNLWGGGGGLLRNFYPVLIQLLLKLKKL